MNGLMMDFPLTLSTIFRRGETIYRRQEIVSRLADKSIHRYTMGDFTHRARRLARALLDLGIVPGDRVATLGWNHGAHLEAYFAIPLIRGVLHTLNLRLHPDELAYIVNHAEDKLLLVDETLLPLWEKIRPLVSSIKTVIVVGATRPVPEGYLEYEGLLAKSRAGRRSAGAGGKRSRRDVLHHRHHRRAQRRPVLAPRAGAPFLRARAQLRDAPHGTRHHPPGRADVPRQRVGTALRRRDARRQDGVAGAAPRSGEPGRSVPARKGDDRRRRADHLDGRAAVPRREPRHVRRLDHPLDVRRRLRGAAGADRSVRAPLRPQDLPGVGHDRDEPARHRRQGARRRSTTRRRTKCSASARSRGAPAPFVELRARGDDGLVAWDGKSMGELEVRGPWIASAYYNRDDCADRFTDDGWFKTGDIVTIDEDGTIQCRIGRRI